MRSKERLREEYTGRLELENENLKRIIATARDPHVLMEAENRIDSLEATVFVCQEKIRELELEYRDLPGFYEEKLVEIKRVRRQRDVLRRAVNAAIGTGGLAVAARAYRVLSEASQDAAKEATRD